MTEIPFLYRRAMPQAWRLVLVAVFILCAAATLWFAFVVDADVPRHAFLSVRPDHLRHIAAFGTLSFVGLTVWGPYAAMTTLLIATGALLELAQWSVGRQMALEDLAASVAGVILGLVAAVVLAAVNNRSRRRRG